MVSPAGQINGIHNSTNPMQQETIPIALEVISSLFCLAHSARMTVEELERYLELPRASRSSSTIVIVKLITTSLCFTLLLDQLRN